jgi:hypothetical protein
VGARASGVRRALPALRITGLVFLVGLAAGLLVSCASQKVEDPLFDAAPLFGMIYDADNQPCDGVQLTVDGVTGPLTDIRGRFMIPDLTRGAHTITARKAGYEDLTATVSFQYRTDVLHLQITAFPQLLEMAQASLADQRWGEAQSYLDRAQKLDAQDSVLRYLFAVLSYKTGNYAAAADALNLIVAGGSREPAVYLFLADLYQKNLGDPARAIDNLEAYLKLRADADVEKRLQDLKAAQAKQGG